MNTNTMFVGTLGKASKIIVFEEKDFKKELAPANAQIEYLEINNKKLVRMTYKV